MREQKTTFLSLRNQDWKLETEKVNELLQHIPTDNISEEKEII